MWAYSGAPLAHSERASRLVVSSVSLDLELLMRPTYDQAQRHLNDGRPTCLVCFLPIRWHSSLLCRTCEQEKKENAQ